MTSVHPERKGLFNPKKNEGTDGYDKFFRKGVFRRRVTGLGRQRA